MDTNKLEGTPFLFTFTSRNEGENGEEVLTEHHRRVSLDELLQRYDQAQHWVDTSPHAYNVTLAGPQVKKTILWDGLREYLVKTFFDGEAFFADGIVDKVIGLVWMTRNGEHGWRNYHLYKVVESVERWEEFESPMTTHSIKQVDQENEDRAFAWARQKGWRDYGAWYMDNPALILAADDRPVRDALADIPSIAKNLETGKFESGACQQTLNGGGNWPRIMTTRKMRQIQELRAKYPTTGLDLAFCPLSVLISRYGYSKVGLLSSMPVV